MKTIIRNGFFALVITMPVNLLYATSDLALQEDESYSFHAEKASLEELDNARGRQGIDHKILNHMNVRGTLTDTTANNNTSGFNVIDHGSFAGAGGMFSVIQNSGNNVLIQDSTIINVTIMP